MSVGIGITTRNRPECLEASLRHFKEFGYGDKIVVLDDNSELRQVNKIVAESFGINVIYKFSNSRLGIAKAKNACLWELRDCEHVFLFDDDAWPQRHNWAETWIKINEANDIGHSMFNITSDAELELNPAFRAVVIPIEEIGADGTKMVAFSNCFGVMLYFNRKCLDALGGFISDAPHLYGYEHAHISERAGSAGFTQGHKYITPSIASELIYSIDISYFMLKIRPYFDVHWIDNFRSSVTLQESSQAEKNSAIMNMKEIHFPLVDPLEQAIVVEPLEQVVEVEPLEQAVAIEPLGQRKEMFEMTILVPSRGRPENIIRLMDAWSTTTTRDTRLLVLVDDDDPKLNEYLAIPNIDIQVGPRLRIGGTLNAVAPIEATKCFAIGFMGDDHLPRTNGWDDRFLTALDGVGVGVTWGNDLYHGANLPTAVVMTSNIVTTLGYFVMPGGIHLFLDNFWLAIGRGIDSAHYLDDVIIEHIHPYFGKAEYDETYTEANDVKVSTADETTFNNYVANQLQDDLQKLRNLK
jgi:glycosyltransferase involved in cell wall biosynthesis